MLEAEIVLDYDNFTVADAVARAVLPDNFETPKGLEIRTICTNGKVTTSIQCRSRLTTFIATIDDLLSCVSVAEKAIQTAKRLE